MRSCRLRDRRRCGLVGRRQICPQHLPVLHDCVVTAQTQLCGRMSVLAGQRQMRGMASAHHTQGNRSGYSMLAFRRRSEVHAAIGGVKVQLTGCGLLMSTHSALLLSVTLDGGCDRVGHAPLIIETRMYGEGSQNGSKWRSDSTMAALARDRGLEWGHNPLHGRSRRRDNPHDSP